MGLAVGLEEKLEEAIQVRCTVLHFLDNNTTLCMFVSIHTKSEE